MKTLVISLALFGLSFSTNAIAQSASLRTYPFPSFKEILREIDKQPPWGPGGLLFTVPEDSFRVGMFRNTSQPGVIIFTGMCPNGKQFFIEVDSAGWLSTSNNYRLSMDYIAEKTIQGWDAAVAQYVQKNPTVRKFKTPHLDTIAEADDLVDIAGATLKYHWRNADGKDWLMVVKDRASKKAAIVYMDYRTKDDDLPNTVIGMNIHRNSVKESWIVDELRLVKNANSDHECQSYPMDLSEVQFQALLQKIYFRMGKSVAQK